MAKPIINRIESFDATKDYTITFSWAGSVSYGNKIAIYDASSLDLVYENPATLAASSAPVRMDHKIPANTLTNGMKYSIHVQSIDSSGITSEWSDRVLFYCYSTPSFSFTNVTNGQLIKSSSLDVSVAYSQAENELLQSYSFVLYDLNKVVVRETNITYDTSSITHTYKNLNNLASYYIRCRGTTVHNMPCDTGYIRIIVSYEIPNNYARMKLENDPLNGYIKYSTNFAMIGYSGDDSDYLFEDGHIVLTGVPGYKDVLTYDQGFKVDGDYTLFLKGKDFIPNSDYLIMGNDLNEKVILSSYTYDDGTTRFKLSVSNVVGTYINYSDPYILDGTFTFVIRKKNSIYKLAVFQQ